MIIRYIIQNIFKCSNIMPFEFYTKRAGVRRSSPASNWCRRTDNKGVFFLNKPISQIHKLETIADSIRLHLVHKMFLGPFGKGGVTIACNLCESAMLSIAFHCWRHQGSFSGPIAPTDAGLPSSDEIKAGVYPFLFSSSSSSSHLLFSSLRSKIILASNQLLPCSDNQPWVQGRTIDISSN